MSRIFIYLMFISSIVSAQTEYNILKEELVNHSILWNKSDFRIQSSYYDSMLKCTHYYIQELIDGLEVYPEISNIHIAKNGNVLFSNINDPRYILKENRTRKLSSDIEFQVLNSYLNLKGIHSEIQQVPLRTKVNEGFKKFQVLDSNNQFLLCKLCYYYKKNKLYWCLRIQNEDLKNGIVNNVYFNILGNQILTESTLNSDCGVEMGVRKDKNQRISIIPHKEYVPTNSGNYRVYSPPVESPLHGNRSLEIEPWLKAANASPLGWHDDGLFTYEHSIGNNVDCYEDMDGDNLPSGGNASRVYGSSNLNFDFNYNPTLSPPSNKNSSLTNLFYWSNVNHDILYQYGFNETSGNFQYNNFGNGGYDLDNIFAEGLDFINGARNNASFICYPDGYPGRMQMYVWQLPVYDSINIESPLNISGKIMTVHSAISPSLYAPYRSEIVLANDGSNYPNQGCNNYINAAQVSGKIAMIDKGICNLNDKITRAQNAGAIGLIVVNVDDNIPSVMGGFSAGVGLPVMNISKTDGEKIKANLQNGVKVLMLPSSALKFSFKGQEYQFARAAFGGRIPNSLNSNLVSVFDASGNPYDACDPIWNNVANTICLIEDGTCEPSYKAFNAQQAGADAVVIGMNNSGLPYILPAGSYGHLVNIPVICISQSDYNDIVSKLPGLGKLSNTIPQLVDGDFDGAIISHEYGHGLSIRLTGGPNNNLCLTNEEQGGEGWSDFLGLMMTIKPGDFPYTLRSIGTWPSGQMIDGTGIRPTQYTVDMSINPSTYSSIKDRIKISQPHGVGYVWCSMLWDLNWALIQQFGYESDLYNSNSTAGNIKAMHLIISGLKLQKCNPGFVNARDAILKADSILYNAANACLIWNVFARRGLGKSADQGSEYLRDDGTQAFDLPSNCTFLTEEQLFGLSVLSLNKLELSGKTINDKTVELNWIYQSDEEIVKIEVYREALGKRILLNTLAGNAMKYVDKNVSQGKYTYQIIAFSNNDNEIKSNQVILNIDESSQWRVYPIPVKEYIELENKLIMNEIINLKILNLEGTIIDKSQFLYKKDDKIRINTEGLISGFYIISIEYRKGKEILKFLKE
ncbi:MAG: M36 family metallopeptidase [Saprospiraceae bacterium]|nr:M36 family metallopeptidase [Saprospiraceae bacterium]